MKKHGWKSLVSGVVLTALVMGLSVPALATTGKKQMNVEYVDIKLTVDGVPAPVGTPFVSEGTTYLPIRAIGEALYKEVRWDGPTHTIYISDPTEASTETQSSNVYVDKSKKTIDVDYLDIKLVVDGKEITPKNVDGKVVEPFAYNGTTYLPVRAVGEALGKTVRWDGATNTVHLGEMPQGTYLVDVCKAAGNAKNIYRATDHQSFEMDGKRYSQGFTLRYSDAAFELGGKYESLTFDLGALPSSYWRDVNGRPITAYLKVYLDGELAQTIKVINNDIQKVTIPLNYAQTISFSWSDDNNAGRVRGFYVVNAVLNGEREAPAKPVPPANATYLVDACTVESGISKYKAAEDEYFEDIFGNKYTNGIYGDGVVNLNGGYKTLKATAICGHWNEWSVSGTYTFSVDGEVVGEISLSQDAPPQTIEIPLNYGMKLEINRKGEYIFLADAILE